jgi:hypothetical protein
VSGAEPALDSSVGFFLFFWLLVVLRVLALVGFVGVRTQDLWKNWEKMAGASSSSR